MLICVFQKIGHGFPKIRVLYPQGRSLCDGQALDTPLTYATPPPPAAAQVSGRAERTTNAPRRFVSHLRELVGPESLRFGPSVTLSLRLFWSSTSMTWENTRKSDVGVPISSPASTHLNSERPTGRRYVHFPHNLRLFHLYSRLIYRLSALSCCFWRNDVRIKNRLRLNVKTRSVLNDILTSFPLWMIPQLTAQLKYVQVLQTIFKNKCLALFSI